MITIAAPKGVCKKRIWRYRLGWEGGQWFMQVFDKNNHLRRARHSPASPLWCLSVMWAK